MKKQIKTLVVQAAKAGFPIGSVGLQLQYDRQFSRSDYENFCKWAFANDGFYNWLVKRICKLKGGVL